MTIRNLRSLLRPISIAVIGGSSRQGSVGQALLSNILTGGFPGPVFAVNPHPVEVDGVQWATTIERLPCAPDLAIVATPADSVAEVIGSLGAIGTRTAVIISTGANSERLRHAMLEAARPYLLRLIGPNSLGILLPHAQLNASFSRSLAAPGRLALISQSGALVTALLDTASERGAGFSGIVSCGDMADVDLGDLIDLFAEDPHSDALLLYMEGVTNPAKFVSAARAASRIKPVIALKSGRTATGAHAAFSHTGALAGSYEVCRAALRRAGVVEVETLAELFDAAEMLCTPTRAAGDRLAIISNGGGAGILAVDALATRPGRPAIFDARTVATLDGMLPAGWSGGNPVDIVGDATAHRYQQVIETVLADDGVDAVLVMNCPTGLAAPGEIARAIGERFGKPQERGKPIIGCWLGSANARAARKALAGAGIPLFEHPEDAVRGFGHLVAAAAARTALTNPATHQKLTEPKQAAARAIIEAARANGRTLLTEVEAKSLLAAYGVPVVRTIRVPDADAVEAACADLPSPYVIKIISPDLSHKSDLGGVALSVPDPVAASAIAAEMARRIAAARPETRIEGFAVETMIERRHAHELIAGLSDDAIFGPVLLVGSGGKAVEVLCDRALDIAPLDQGLARAMLERTRISHLLAGYRDEPAADIAAVTAVLRSLSAIAVDLPEVLDIDINPLLVDPGGAIALDARIRLSSEAHPASRLVIRPVPMDWAADLVTRDGIRLQVRPVRPDDEAVLADLFHHVTQEDLRFRFLTSLREVRRDMLVQMCHVDYSRTIAFLGFVDEVPVTTALLACAPGGEEAEVALSIREGWKGRGVSWTLLDHVLAYARAQGVRTIRSIESRDNQAAIALEREMGFVAVTDPDDPSELIVEKHLTAG